jgi:hypothetical protein
VVGSLQYHVACLLAMGSLMLLLLLLLAAASSGGKGDSSSSVQKEFVAVADKLSRVLRCGHLASWLSCVWIGWVVWTALAPGSSRFAPEGR